jgi:type I restriction enzyme, S subunit
MGGYQRYEAYQDSGIEWLGEIPAHWNVKRSRFLLVTNPSKNEIRLPDDALVSFIAMESVGEYGGLDLTVQKTLDEIGSGYTYFAEGDVVVAKITPCFENGKGAISLGLTNKMAFGTTELHVLRPSENLNSLFLFYLTISYSFRKLGESEMYGAGGQKRIPERFLKDLRMAVPPLEEQKSIARFLDYKTAQIDALIAKKESLLKKLAEKRSALISQAVTKGLDPKVPMQDSGVEWLGEVPAHYQLKRLKFVIEQIIDAEHKTAPYDADGEFLVVRTTNVRNGKLLLKNGKYVDKDTCEKWTARAVPEPGDILFTREAPAGEACLVPEEPILCLGQRMVLFKFDHGKYDGYFLLNSIYSGIADDFVKSLSLGSTVSHFNMSDIGSIPLIIPPYSEQQQISQWLELYIGKFDAQAGKVKLGIQQLKEYRTALITNAVTGSIDVRNVPIPNDLQEAA